MINHIYNKALELVNKYCSTDATHQTDHIERVLKLIEYLAEKEKISGELDWGSLKLAAIFHDLGSSQRIKQLKRCPDKFSTGKHAEQSFKIAQKFLKQEGAPKEKILKIRKIIFSHGTEGLKNNIEGHLLHDADLLDGIGLVGLLRIVAFGGQINRDVLSSLRFAKQKIKSREFRTKTGKALGKKRIKNTQKCLDEINKELTFIST